MMKCSEVKCTYKIIDQHSIKLLSLNLYSKTIQFLKKRPLSFVISKKLHIKLVRMKSLNCRDEEPSWFSNINQTIFVFQQESLLSHRSDWWKTFRKNLVVEVMFFNNISFSFFATKRLPERPEENDCFQTLSSFLPIIIVPEYAVGSVVGQTIFTKGKKTQFTPFWRKTPISFENIQVVVIHECCNQNYLILIGLCLTKLCDKNKNWSLLNQEKSPTFCRQF